MVKKTQWILLLTTFILSVCSLVFIILAYSMDEWIRAEAENNIALRNSQIHYGLFSGSLTRNLLDSPTHHKLTLTCLYDENACIYSCQDNQDFREEELRRILAGVPLLTCPTTNDRSMDFTSYSLNQSNRNGINGNRKFNLMSKVTILRPFEDVIDPGLWLTTIIFLSVCAAFSLFTAVMTLVNILFNPIEPLFSVFGLYIWNSIASGTALLTMILWGTLFGTSLSGNIAITDTLRSESTYNSNGLASLGYCYWLILIPLVFHATNIGLLLLRKRIIEAEPPPPTINPDKNDLTIMLY